MKEKLIDDRPKTNLGWIGRSQKQKTNESKNSQNSGDHPESFFPKQLIEMEQGWLFHNPKKARNREVFSRLGSVPQDTLPNPTNPNWYPVCRT